MWHVFIYLECLICFHIGACNPVCSFVQIWQAGEKITSENKVKFAPSSTKSTVKFKKTHLVTINVLCKAYLVQSKKRPIAIPISRWELNLKSAKYSTQFPWNVCDLPPLVLALPSKNCVFLLYVTDFFVRPSAVLCDLWRGDGEASGHLPDWRSM